jgi:hypothetical protein
LTISADMLGRTIVNTTQFAIVPQTFQYKTNSTTNPGPFTTTRNTFSITGTGNETVLLGIVSAKFNVPSTPFLITGSVLFPLNHSGLRPDVTPVVGMEYSFKR